MPMDQTTVTPTSRPSTQDRGSEQVPLPGPEVLIKWLRDMMQIREFEVRAIQAYQNKFAGGFLHVYNGQEAVAVGSIGCVATGGSRDHGLPGSWSRPGPRDGSEGGHG